VALAGSKDHHGGIHRRAAKVTETKERERAKDRILLPKEVFAGVDLEKRVQAVLVFLAFNVSNAICGADKMLLLLRLLQT